MIRETGDDVRTDAATRGGPSALLRLVRPRQWTKNVLVFAATFAAGEFLDAEAMTRSFAAFVAFCLAASGTYCLNDVIDADADRRHPDKRRRPVASGAVSERTASVLGVFLLAAAVALAAVVNWRLLLVVVSYVALATAYNFHLKRVPVLDIATVAGGFILRSVAGGVAVPVPISQWFLTVVGFGSLLMVAGKRHAEHMDLGDEAGAVRETLDVYSPGYLRFLRSVSAGVCLAGYCLWAFERADGGQSVWYQLSIVPFVLAILYYALRLDQGAGAEPEEIVLGDRTLQVIGVVWAALFGIGVYVQ